MRIYSHTVPGTGTADNCSIDTVVQVNDRSFVGKKIKVKSVK